MFPEMQGIKIMFSALKNADNEFETYGSMFRQSLGHFSAVFSLPLLALTVTYTLSLIHGALEIVTAFPKYNGGVYTTV